MPVQDLPVILKRDNLQSLDKVFDFFIALKFCNSDFYFLNRLKKCEEATYNIVSVYVQADLRLCSSHIPHCWKSHVPAQFSNLQTHRMA